MSEHSTISWTGATWPIVAGCEYVSPGCSNCWAVRDSWRLAHNPHREVRQAFAGTVRKQPDGKLVWTGHVRTLPERLWWPMHWKKPRKIFVCSQSDLFHRAVPFEFIAAVFGVMAMAKQHTFQVLTKHPDRAREFFDWIQNDADGPTWGCILHARDYGPMTESLRAEPSDDGAPWPLPNVWFGVTTEDQRRADERLEHLRHIPAAKHWVSAEPLLEHIDLSPWLDFLDWVVGGGESAQTRKETRDCDLAWLLSLRAQCAAAGVPYLNKQLGSRPIWNEIRLEPPRGKTSRYKWHEPERWPVDLRKQEFPG